MQVHSSTTCTVCIQRASGIGHKAPGAPPSAATPPEIARVPTVSFDNSLPTVARRILPLLEREWKGTSVSREEWG